jgi:predicted RNase H-like HicB family nuclease
VKLTAVFEPAKEGGYTCFVEEFPAAISHGESLEEAKANFLDALKLVLECQRELAEKRQHDLPLLSRDQHFDFDKGVRRLGG